MEIEEIEEEYNKENEAAKIDFLMGLRHKVNRRALEKQYKDRLAKARAKYYEQTKLFLDGTKQNKQKKGIKKKDETKTKPFVVLPANYKLSRKDRFELWKDKKLFKLKLRAKRLKRNIVTPPVSAFALKSKIMIKRSSKATGNFFKIVGIGIYHFLKTVTLDFYHGFINLSKLIFEIFLMIIPGRKKGKKSKEDEAKELIKTGQKAR